MEQILEPLTDGRRQRASAARWHVHGDHWQVHSGCGGGGGGGGGRRRSPRRRATLHLGHTRARSGRGGHLQAEPPARLWDRVNHHVGGSLKVDISLRHLGRVAPRLVAHRPALRVGDRHVHGLRLLGLVVELPLGGTKSRCDGLSPLDLGRIERWLPFIVRGLLALCSSCAHASCGHSCGHSCEDSCGRSCSTLRRNAHCSVLCGGAFGSSSSSSSRCGAIDLRHGLRHLHADRGRQLGGARRLSRRLSLRGRGVVRLCTRVCPALLGDLHQSEPRIWSLQPAERL